MYRKRSTPSVRFLLKMLESCCNQAGTGADAPHVLCCRQPSATSQSAQDQEPLLTLRIGTAVATVPTVPFCGAFSPITAAGEPILSPTTEVA